MVHPRERDHGTETDDGRVHDRGYRREYRRGCEILDDHQVEFAAGQQQGRYLRMVEHGRVRVRVADHARHRLRYAVPDGVELRVRLQATDVHVRQIGGGAVREVSDGRDTVAAVQEPADQWSDDAVMALGRCWKYHEYFRRFGGVRADRQRVKDTDSDGGGYAGRRPPVVHFFNRRSPFFGCTNTVVVFPGTPPESEHYNENTCVRARAYDVRAKVEIGRTSEMSGKTANRSKDCVDFKKKDSFRRRTPSYEGLEKNLASD